eukprot:13686756-Alexandrium_andersonii.AAC.1
MPRRARPCACCDVCQFPGNTTFRGALTRPSPPPRPSRREQERMPPTRDRWGARHCGASWHGLGRARGRAGDVAASPLHLTTGSRGLRAGRLSIWAAGIRGPQRKSSVTLAQHSRGM